MEKDLRMLVTAAGDMSQCVCPGGQDDQEHPGLDQQQCGQQDQDNVLGHSEATP